VPESGESCSLQFVILPHDFSSSSSIILSFGCLQHATKAQSVSLLSGFRGFWEWDHEDSFLSCHCSGWLYVKTWLSRLRSLSQILLPRVCNFFDLASSVLLLLLLCLSGWLPRGVHWFAYVPAPETVVSIGQYRLYFCTYLSRVLDWLMPSVWIKRLEWNLSYS
jgi:hypothetical protein